MEASERMSLFINYDCVCTTMISLKLTKINGDGIFQEKRGKDIVIKYTSKSCQDFFTSMRTVFLHKRKIIFKF